MPAAPAPCGALAPAHVDAHRQFLAQFHAELIEGVHAPNRALHEHAVLVQGQDAAEGARRGLRIHEQRTGAIAFVHAVDGDAVDLGGADAGLAHVRLDFRQRIAVGERLRLRETVLQGQILPLGAAPGAAQRRDEIERLGQGALVQHLKERMLGIRARFTPDDGRRGEVDVLSLQRYRLAVAFHFELLQIRRQAREPLVVGQHREGGQIQESAVPHAQAAP